MSSAQRLPVSAHSFDPLPEHKVEFEMTPFARPHWRASRRWSIMWPATIIAPDHYQYLCTILDISEGGARVESDFSPIPKMRMNLQCYRFGTLCGEVVWTRGKMAGIRFDAIPAEALLLLKSIVPGLGRQRKAA